MASLTNPLEIAREALRRLAIERIPPTPENYRALYLRIAGKAQGEPLTPTEKLVTDLVATLPRDSDESARLATQCEQAMQAHQWELVGKLLAKQIAAPRPPPPPTTPPPTAASGAEEDSNLGTLRELCAFLLDTPLVAHLASNPALAEEARALGRKARSAVSRQELEALLPQVRRLAMRVEMATEDQQELTAGVVHLLQLVVDNIGELVLDDRWLGGQMAMLREILAKPLDVRAIDSAERRLREVIVKQSNVKAGLAEAQRSLKQLLSEFVGQLASFARDTGAYHAKIDSYTERIRQAEHVLDLQDVVQEVLRETKAIQTAAQRTHGELHAARARVDEAEQRVATLEAELAKTSDLVRHDQLTGTLNRRGLEEALGREIARADRRQAPLCLAVLDVDNFKQLNDALGHQAGDAALVHLSTVIRSALRPQDTLARYGGEEFVVLLPETELDAAQAAMVRVQRELTRRFFLHNNQRVLVTFSAGVTRIPHGETKEAAIQRADHLMYEAKQSGKNRVVAG